MGNVMSTINVSLSDSLRVFVEQRIAEGGYSTASEYIHHLIHEDQRRQADTRLEAMLLEGIDSGEPIEVSEAWWEEKKAKLSERLQRKASGWK